MKGNTLSTEEDIIFGIYEIYRKNLQLKEIYLPLNLWMIYRWKQGKIDLKFFQQLCVEERHRETIKILGELCEKYRYKPQSFLRALKNKGYRVEEVDGMFRIKFGASSVSLEIQMIKELLDLILGEEKFLLN